MVRQPWTGQTKCAREVAEEREALSLSGRSHVQISPRRPNIQRLYVLVLGPYRKTAGQNSACVFSGLISDAITLRMFTALQLG